MPVEFDLSHNSGTHTANNRLGMNTMRFYGLISMITGLAIFAIAFINLMFIKINEPLISVYFVLGGLGVMFAGMAMIAASTIARNAWLSPLGGLGIMVSLGTMVILGGWPWLIWLIVDFEAATGFHRSWLGIDIRNATELLGASLLIIVGGTAVLMQSVRAFCGHLAMQQPRHYRRV